MKRVFKNSIWILLLIFIFDSCINSLTQAPTNRFTENNYWTSPTKARLVLNTAYMQMDNSNWFFYNCALSDNAYVDRGDATNAKTISAGQASTTTPRFENEWSSRYAGIKTCNIFLQNIDKVSDISDSLKKEMKAEARFIRAYQYFYLTTWFGAVPLFKKNITLKQSKVIAQTSHANVVKFIHEELESIVPDLPTNTELPPSEEGQITKGAAIALDARVYLYDNNWKGVVKECQKLINNNNYGSYHLFPSYAGLFMPQNQNNSSVILEYNYVPHVRTWDNFIDFAPLSIGARDNAMAPLQSLVNSYIMLNGKPINAPNSGYDPNHPFKNRDPRLKATIVYNGYPWEKPDGSIDTIYTKPGSAPANSNAARDEYQAGSNSSQTGYYLRKYYDPTSGVTFQSGLNLILIRYADVLLMYAEAKNELNQMTPTVWDETVKAIRKRAGFTEASALDFNSSWTQAQLRQIIRNERRDEFAMEGLRIFDIRRWKTADQVLNGYPHGAQYGPKSIDNGYIRLEKRTFNPGKDYLWPIPQKEMDLNHNLVQNPGWAG